MFSYACLQKIERIRTCKPDRSRKESLPRENNRQWFMTFSVYKCPIISHVLYTVIIESPLLTDKERDQKTQPYTKRKDGHALQTKELAGVYSTSSYILHSHWRLPPLVSRYFSFAYRRDRGSGHSLSLDVNQAEVENKRAPEFTVYVHWYFDRLT